MAGLVAAFDNTTTSNLSMQMTTFARYDKHGMYIHPHWDQYRDVIDDAPKAFMMLLGVYISIVSVIGTIGNLIVLWIFSTTPSLKTPSNLIVINLAITDLGFSAIIGFPMMAIACFERDWIWGFVGCQWYAFIAGVTGLVSINSLTAISFDRYMVIAKPLYMMQAATKTRSFKQIIFVWIYAICWVLPPWFGWGAFMPEGFGFSCTWDYLTRTTNNISFNICFIAFEFALPVCVIIFCYVGIVGAVAKNRKEMGRMSSDNANQTKQEIQIAKVVAINVTMFVITWLPYVTIAMMGVAGRSSYVTPYTTEIPVMLAKASGAWNPLIYALSHPRYRDALRKSKLPFRFLLGKPLKTEGSIANTRMSEMSQREAAKPSDAAGPSTSQQVPTIELTEEQKQQGSAATSKF